MRIAFRETFCLPVEDAFGYFPTPHDWVRLFGFAGQVSDRGDGWYAVPLKRFPFPLVTRVFLFALTVLTLWVAISGSWPLHFLGMPRYFLLVFPMFFAMAKFLRPRPWVLVGWVLLCGGTYWSAELCGHIGRVMGGWE